MLPRGLWHKSFIVDISTILSSCQLISTILCDIKPLSRVDNDRRILQFYRCILTIVIATCCIKTQFFYKIVNCRNFLTGRFCSVKPLEILFVRGFDNFFWGLKFNNTFLVAWRKVFSKKLTSNLEKNHFKIKVNFPSWRKMMGYQGGFNYNCQTKAKILHCHRKFRKFYATPVNWNCPCRRLFYNCHPVNCKFLCHRPQIC